MVSFVLFFSSKTEKLMGRKLKPEDLIVTPESHHAKNARFVYIDGVEVDYTRNLRKAFLASAPATHSRYKYERACRGGVYPVPYQYRKTTQKHRIGLVNWPNFGPNMDHAFDWLAGLGLERAHPLVICALAEKYPNIQDVLEFRRGGVCLLESQFSKQPTGTMWSCNIDWSREPHPDKRQACYDSYRYTPGYAWYAFVDTGAKA